jgi:hypothetical protein
MGVTVANIAVGAAVPSAFASAVKPAIISDISPVTGGR